jgi:hypothetical protein
MIRITQIDRPHSQMRTQTMDGSRRRRLRPAWTRDKDPMRARWYGAWRSARFARRMRGASLPGLDAFRHYLDTESRISTADSAISLSSYGSYTDLRVHR